MAERIAAAQRGAAAKEAAAQEQFKRDEKTRKEKENKKEEDRQRKIRYNANRKALKEQLAKDDLKRREKEKRDAEEKARQQEATKEKERRLQEQRRKAEKREQEKKLREAAARDRADSIVGDTQRPTPFSPEDQTPGQSPTGMEPTREPAAAPPTAAAPLAPKGPTEAVVEAAFKTVDQLYAAAKGVQDRFIRSKTKELKKEAWKALRALKSAAIDFCKKYPQHQKVRTVEGTHLAFACNYLVENEKHLKDEIKTSNKSRAAAAEELLDFAYARNGLTRPPDVVFQPSNPREAAQCESSSNRLQRELEKRIKAPRSRPRKVAPPPYPYPVKAASGNDSERIISNDIERQRKELEYCNEQKQSLDLAKSLQEDGVTSVTYHHDEASQHPSKVANDSDAAVAAHWETETSRVVA